MSQEIKKIDIILEILIKAKIGQVWNSLIKDVDIWWSKEFYTSPKTREFIIEPKVDGRMYEDYGNDEGLLWANVIVLDSPNVIEFKGHLSPDFGGPAISFLKLSFKEEGESTLLTLTDSVLGNVTEKTKDTLTQGWKFLYEDGFKNYVEGLKK